MIRDYILMALGLGCAFPATRCLQGATRETRRLRGALLMLGFYAFSVVGVCLAAPAFIHALEGG